MRSALHAIAALLLTTLAVSGCDRPSPPAPVSAAANAPQQAIARIGDVSIRASVVQTSTLGTAVASQYGIVRDDKTVLLLVAVRQGSEALETSIPAQVTATVTDLRGRTQPIAMRELRVEAQGADALVDHVGTIDIDLPDTLRFDVTVTREGGATSRLQFNREFYPR